MVTVFGQQNWQPSPSTLDRLPRFHKRAFSDSTRSFPWQLGRDSLGLCANVCGIPAQTRHDIPSSCRSVSPRDGPLVAWPPRPSSLRFRANPSASAESVAFLCSIGTPLFADCLQPQMDVGMVLIGMQGERISVLTPDTARANFVPR